MIREVHKIVSEWNNWYDKYVVYYVSGRKREYFADGLPKSVKKFIGEANCKWEIVGRYWRYYK